MLIWKSFRVLSFKRVCMCVQGTTKLMLLVISVSEGFCITLGQTVSWRCFYTYPYVSNHQIFYMLNLSNFKILVLKNIREITSVSFKVTSRKFLLQYANPSLSVIVYFLPPFIRASSKSVQWPYCSRSQDRSPLSTTEVFCYYYLTITHSMSFHGFLLQF